MGYELLIIDNSVYRIKTANIIRRIPGGVSTSTYPTKIDINVIAPIINHEKANKKLGSKMSWKIVYCNCINIPISR